MNIQCISKHDFDMYLAMYISKPEPSSDVKFSENASVPEKYLCTRIIDMQLGFNQYHFSRSIEFLPTEAKPKQHFLKSKQQLAILPHDSEEVYQLSNFKPILNVIPLLQMFIPIILSVVV